jgi:hypothetical protein
VEWIVIAIGLSVLLGIAAVSAHLGLTWADRRGLVWYRNPNRRPPRSLGLVEEIYHPGIHNVIEEETRDATEADRSESGAPPEAGSS